MDKYRDAFGNLQVPDDMADRILRAAEKDEAPAPAEAAPTKKGRLTILYRAAAGVAACLVLGLSLWLVKPQQAAQITPQPSAPAVGSTVPDTSTAPVTDAAPTQTVQPSAGTKPAGGKTGGSPAATARPVQTPAAETPAAGDDTQVTNPYEELSDAAALAAKLGYAPKLPQTLPAGFAESGTVLIGGKLAQVSYTNGAATVSYRTAKGADDVSGDYNSYTEQSSENGVTLKGGGGLVSLAVWTDDTSSYALSFSPGVTKQEALAWAGGVG